MNEMVEHVRAYVCKSRAYLKSDDLQMLDGAPTDGNILEIDKIGRENRRKYYEKYLECGKPDEQVEFGLRTIDAFSGVLVLLPVFYWYLYWYLH